MSKIHDKNAYQTKGFCSTRCYENILFLKQAIKRGRTNNSETNIVFLDLAKAFDTVPHSTIDRALKRQQVHQRYINIVKEKYKDMKTKIKLNNEETRMISINSGVKLSPTLFNLLMDELITDISKMKCGIQVEGERVSIMAFADDLVLLTDNYNDMNLVLKEASKFFNARNLKVNPRKMSVLTSNTGTRQKKPTRSY